MLKRIFAFVLCFAICVCLIACEDDNDVTGSSNKSSVPTQSVVDSTDSNSPAQNYQDYDRTIDVDVPKEETGKLISSEFTKISVNGIETDIQNISNSIESISFMETENWIMQPTLVWLEYADKDGNCLWLSHINSQYISVMVINKDNVADCTFFGGLKIGSTEDDVINVATQLNYHIQNSGSFRDYIIRKDAFALVVRVQNDVVCEIQLGDVNKLEIKNLNYAEELKVVNQIYQEKYYKLNDVTTWVGMNQVAESTDGSEFAFMDAFFLEDEEMSDIINFNTLTLDDLAFMGYRYDSIVVDSKNENYAAIRLVLQNNKKCEVVCDKNGNVERLNVVTDAYQIASELKVGPGISIGMTCDTMKLIFGDSIRIVDDGFIVISNDNNTAVLQMRNGAIYKINVIANKLIKN